MKCSEGFTLIELIVATLIASMITSVLLTALYQSSKVQATVDTVIDFSERIGIVANLLEKDLAGAFVPASASAHVPSDASADKEKKIDRQKEGEAQKPTDKNNSAQQEAPAKKEEKKPIEKIFYSTNKNGMLDTLTFVTNNPLVVFVGKDVGVVKPKAVRVQYTLKPEHGSKDSYVLTRQESNELDLAEYKNVRAQEVIGGIKKLTVSFTARIEKKQESPSAKATADTAKEGATEQKQQKEKPKKLYEYKVQPEWVSEQKKEASKEAPKEGGKKEPEFPRIPYSVEFKMTLWDKQSKKEKEFTFVCHIPVDSIEAQMKDKDKKQQEAPEKKENKPEGGEDAAKGGKGKQPQGAAMNATRVTSTSTEVITLNGAEALNNAMESLKKLLGHA